MAKVHQLIRFEGKSRESVISKFNLWAVENVKAEIVNDVVYPEKDWRYEAKTVSDNSMVNLEPDELWYIEFNAKIPIDEK